MSDDIKYPGQGGWGEAYANLHKEQREEIGKTVPNFNELTSAETERLALLAEEMGECIQVIGKILRHGYESHNPLDEDSLHNRAYLEKEIGDVELIIFLMAEANDINRNAADRSRIEKGNKIGRWLHHQD